MRVLENVKARKAGEVVHPNTKEWCCLNEEHVLGPARNVNKRDLRFHIMVEHGVSAAECKTQSDYGKLHLLIHAVLAHPDLRALLDLSNGWGK